jgi:DNA-binding NarL/FixJ family response regulator
LENDIRVGLIHRNRLFREGLAIVLSQQQDISVITCLAEVKDALVDIKGLRPDVLILDFSQRGQDGLRETRQLHEAAPEAKLLLMGLTESEADILACIEAGASGILQREASLEELVRFSFRLGYGIATRGKPALCVRCGTGCQCLPDRAFQGLAGACFSRT